MNTERTQDPGLDALFDLARDRRADAPSEALFDAVLADAAQVQAAAISALPDPAPAPQPSVVARLLAAIGGWPSAAGLAAATLTGVWIGISPPEVVDTLTASLLASDLSDADMLYGFDVLLAEG